MTRYCVLIVLIVISRAHYTHAIHIIKSKIDFFNVDIVSYVYMDKHRVIRQPFGPIMDFNEFLPRNQPHPGIKLFQEKLKAPVKKN